MPETIKIGQHGLALRADALAVFVKLTNNMTHQELQIEVAKEMGWHIEQDEEEFWRAYNPEGVPEYRLWLSAKAAEQSFPPYSTSLDAIQKAALEKFIDPREQRLFHYKFEAQFKYPKVWFWQLTAADWCEAFLATCKEIKSL